MRSKGVIFILSAPSGAGKTTLIKRLRKVFPDLKLSISYTTRKPRSGEIPGQDYFFVAQKKFELMRAKGEFVEWANVHGNLYGTPQRPLEKSIRSGKDILLDIDVQGNKKVKARYPNSVSIFLLPPSWKELERRLAWRGTDGRETIRQRLQDARRELREIKSYDYFIVNREIQHALELLKSVVVAERMRVFRVQKWTASLLH
ncbi:MAG: guanylate kinase [Deltaproteobacteria bacterium]|nr:guanylate kinase [Deltaproteobacteria bacterium]